MPKVYSYLRFSTPEQAKGDSRRRQEQLAQDYAQRKGLELDDTLNLRDSGLSAYSGANITEGALGVFLGAIKEGRIDKGSYLLVESLDRLSRRKPREALSPFLDIINAGVTIVTTIDGKEHSEDALDANGYSLFESLIKMGAAHEESHKKSVRLKAAWDNKKKEAVKEGKIVTSKTLGWLTVSDDGKTFNPIPERVAIVKRIFQMCLDGYGQGKTADILQDEGVPTFTARAKRWRESYIAKILNNRAVLGEYQPHTLIQAEGTGKKRRVVDGEPVPNYFPSIIEPSTFYAVQDIRQQRRVSTVKEPTPHAGRKGARFSNLFQGVGVCVCGSPMRYLNKGEPPKGGKYLICSLGKGVEHKLPDEPDKDSLDMGGYKRKPSEESDSHPLASKAPLYRYDITEATILLALKRLDLSSLVGDRKGELEKRREATNNELMATRGQLTETTKVIERLLDAISTTNTPPTSLVQRLSDTETGQLTLQARLGVLEGSLVALDKEIAESSQSSANFYTLLAEVADGSENLPDAEAYALRQRLNGLLRRELNKVVFHSKEPLRVTIYFKNGSYSDVLIPKKSGMSMSLLSSIKRVTVAKTMA